MYMNMEAYFYTKYAQCVLIEYEGHDGGDIGITVTLEMELLQVFMAIEKMKVMVALVPARIDYIKKKR